MLNKQEREDLKKERRALAQKLRAQILYVTPLTCAILIALTWLANRFLNKSFSYEDILILVIVIQAGDFVVDLWQLRKVNKKLKSSEYLVEN